MKKILFSIFTLALATMVGCQKSDIDDTLNNPTNSKSKITVTANIVNDGQTRVALTPETDGEGKPVVKVDWKNSGEAFDVFIMDGEYNLLASKKFEQIEGTNQFSSESPYDGTFNICLAYYPSGLIVHSGNFQQSKDIFSLQNGKLSEERTYMSAGVYALNENTKFNFRHMTTLLMPKFRVQGATENLSPANIASITFKSERVNGGDTDIKIDCSELGAEDDIYVYLPEDSASGKIEVVVTTNDEKVYDGEIDLEGRPLLTGKLYTANIWLTPETTISYTTTNNEKLELDNASFKEHNFEDGVGTIVLNGTTVPDDAFASQATLQTITLSSEITKIGASAFESCGALTTVTMPGVTEIGVEAFNMEDFDKNTQVLNNQLSNIDLSKVQKFGIKALYKVALREINLSSATEIGDKAFAEMYNLESVTMPEQDCTIGKHSFAECRTLTTIDLTNASAIGETAFQKCYNLTTVLINRATPPTVVVKNGITPFAQCNAALTIYVPQNYIANYEGSPLYSFIDKGSNTIIYTTTDNTTLTLSNAAWGEGEGCIYTDHSFANNVGKIVLKDGVNAIPNEGFYCKKTLKSVNLPSQITTISNLSFAACSSLSSINLNNITVIGVQAFSSCFALSEVTMPNNNYTIGNQSFCNCAITEIDLSKASFIDDYAFQGCNNLTTVIINNPTHPSFGTYNPFIHCNSLESIYVPNDKVGVYKAIGALSDVENKIKGISPMPQ